MLKNLIDFNRASCLKKMQTHCLNESLKIVETTNDSSNTDNLWQCSILWGNNTIHGNIVVRFSTLSVLAMANTAFKDTQDKNLFNDARDFMKEFCNFYAGFIKSTLNNHQIDVKISLPIVSNKISTQACYGGDIKDLHTDRWKISGQDSSVEVFSYLQFKENIDISAFEFLNTQETEVNNNSNEGDIEFF